MAERLNWRGFAMAAWVITAATAVAVIVALAQQRWAGAGMLAVACAAAAGATLWARREVAAVFPLLFALAAGTNAAGYTWDLFKAPGPYDEIVHGYTIFVITLTFGIPLFRRIAPDFRRHAALFVVAVASFGIAVGALWEVVEWLLDMIPGLAIVNTYFDTISDIAMDSLGATLAALLSLWVFAASGGRKVGK
jgi:hypothetical protein